MTSCSGCTARSSARRWPSRAAAAGGGSTWTTRPRRPAAPRSGWLATEGALLGQYASMPVQLRWGDREVRSSWGMDVFLSPAARGRGVGARLFTAWSDHVEVALGLGLTASSYGLFQKLRYTDVGPVPFHYRILDARAVAARRLGPRWAGVAGRLLDLGWRLRHRGPATRLGRRRRTDRALRRAVRRAVGPRGRVLRDVRAPRRRLPQLEVRGVPASAVRHRGGAPAAAPWPASR